MSAEVVGNLIAATALVISGVWVVGRINSTTTLLGAQISSLTRAIDALTNKFDTLDDKVDLQSERLVKLEAWCDSHKEVR